MNQSVSLGCSMCMDFDTSLPSPYHPIVPVRINFVSPTEMILSCCSHTCGRELARIKTEPSRRAGDGWEDNAKVILDNCPYTIRVREGGGLEDLLSSLVVTFQGMQSRLEKLDADKHTDKDRSRGINTEDQRG